MKKFMFFVAATLVLAAVGCSKEDAGVANGDVQYVSELTINFEGDSRVNATHSEAGLTFDWEDGEEIMIFESNNENSVTYYYVYDADSKSFKAKNDSYKMTAGKEYFATNNRRSGGTHLSLEDGKSVVKMNLAIVGGAKGLPGIPLISDVFTATAEGTIATMHHLCGVVEIPVKLDASTTLTTVNQFLIYVSGGKLANDFTATPYTPYLHSTTEGYDTAYSENKDVVLNKESATSIFIPVLPGTYTNPDINYLYTNSSDVSSSGYKSLTGTLTVTRGKLVKVPEITVRLY